jgi:hypothetical protein
MTKQEGHPRKAPLDLDSVVAQYNVSRDPEGSYQRIRKTELEMRERLGEATAKGQLDFIREELRAETSI